MSYYIGRLRDGAVPADYNGLQRYEIRKRLGDFSASLLDGVEYVVYRSMDDLRIQKPHGFYKSQGGKLKRNKYLTAITELRELLKEVA